MDHKIFDAARERFPSHNSSPRAWRLTQDKSAFTIETDRGIDHRNSLLCTDLVNSLLNEKRSLFKNKHNGECSALAIAKHHNDHHLRFIFFKCISHIRNSALTVAHPIHLPGVTVQKLFNHNKNSAFTVTLNHDTHPLEFSRNVYLTLRKILTFTIESHYKNHHLTNITNQKNTFHSPNKPMRKNRYKLRFIFPNTSKPRQCINTEHKRQMVFRRADGTVLDSEIVRKGGGQ